MPYIIPIEKRDKMSIRVGALLSMVASYLMRIMPGRYLLTLICAIELRRLLLDGLVLVNGALDLIHKFRLARVVLVRDYALHLRVRRNRI